MPRIPDEARARLACKPQNCRHHVSPQGAGCGRWAYRRCLAMSHDGGDNDKAPTHTDEKSESQGAMSVIEWEAALLRVQQALALIDAPLASGRPVPPRPMMHDGLLYGLHDLLAPVESVLHMNPSSAQGLAAAITAESSLSPTQGLHTFIQKASHMLVRAEQVKTLLSEPLGVSGNQRNALSMLERGLERSPPTPHDEREILVRIRKKRRQLDAGSHIPDTLKPVKEADNIIVRARLLPVPDSLTFEAATPWVDRVLKRSPNQPLSMAVQDLLHEFQLYINERCKQDSCILTDSQGSSPFPARRVRARLAFWTDTLSSIEVELRDVGLVRIQVRADHHDVCITNMSICAPMEYQSISGSNAVQPSRFMYYGDISNHLLVHALSSQRSYGRGLEALAQTCLHVAGLRTLYDALPTPSTSVAPMISRVTYGMLKPDALLDHNQTLVWHWCRIVSSMSSNQGEWCAYVPSLP